MLRKGDGNRNDRCGITLLVIWSTFSASFIACYKTQGNVNDNSLISNFVRVIQPYIRSLQLSADTKTALPESSVQKHITQVIYNLKPFLQDNDTDEENNLEDEETTIIEFQPKDLRERKKQGTGSLKTNTGTYEKIKSKIKLALKNESVSDKVIKLVTRTLDDLIEQVIDNQCTWKSVDHAVFRKGKVLEHNNITIEAWEDIKQEFLNIIEENYLNKSMTSFKEFHNFFSNVMNRTKKLSTKYKIKCELVKDNNDETRLKKGKSNGVPDNCKDFKICSDELIKFLTGFHKSLKDTTESVFKNYAAMYARDVNTEDSQEKVSVPDILNNLSSSVDRRVSKVFKKELINLNFDPEKKREANIRILKDFIQITVKHVQNHVKKHLASDLASLRARLLLDVQKDINTNLDVDLGNVEADVKAGTCAAFATCNSRFAGSRRALDDLNRPHKPYSVFLKLQVTLDDQLKDDIARYLFRSNRRTLNHGQFNPNSLTGMKNRMTSKYYSNINVTRTTVAKVLSIETTNSNVSEINEVSIKKT